jgi:hypothetical protein
MDKDHRYSCAESDRYSSGVLGKRLYVIEITYR